MSYSQLDELLDNFSSGEHHILEENGLSSINKTEDKKIKSELQIVLEVFYLTLIPILFGVVIFFVQLKRRSFDILVFTDLHRHHDYEYTKSSKNHCKTKISNSSEEFKFGQYGCDTSAELLSSFFSGIKEKVDNPSLVLFSGDASCTWFERNYSLIKRNINDIKKGIIDNYGNITFVINLGNGEFMPNYGSDETDSESFKNLYDSFGEYIPDDQKENFLKGGYYYIDDHNLKLRIISFNSVIYSVRRNLSSETDPYDQFRWLKEVLQSKYKTLFLFHIHPGAAFSTTEHGWYDKYIIQLSRVFSYKSPDYAFGAHTHLDLFLPIFNTGEKPVISISNPSVSPQHGNNPSFRKYVVRNGNIIDYYQYYADIRKNPDILKWELSYRFRSYYNKNDLSQNSLFELLSELTSSSVKMRGYIRNIYSNAFMYSDWIQCSLKTSTFENLKSCMDSYPASHM